MKKTLYHDAKVAEWRYDDETSRDGTKILCLGNPCQGIYAKKLKRALDVFLVAMALPIVLPLFSLLVALVYFNGGNPLYIQDRVGLNGKTFRILKIRTMVDKSDIKLKQYLTENRAARLEWSENQKLKNDPRVTKLGRLLRKTSLDELPQLWNVAIGDMSLVGPRPMTCDQRPLYPGTAYFFVRPGITGEWQTMSRNNSDFSSRAIYDTNYVYKLSFWVDLVILARTIMVVIKGTGY